MQGLQYNDPNNVQSQEPNVQLSIHFEPSSDPKFLLAFE